MIFREPILSFSRPKPFFVLPLPQLPPDIPGNNISEQPRFPQNPAFPYPAAPETTGICIPFLYILYNLYILYVPYNSISSAPIFLYFVFFLASPIPVFSFSSISPDSPLCFSISASPFPFSIPRLFPTHPTYATGKNSGGKFHSPHNLCLQQ